jgi:membrane dipeptidase
MVKIFNYILFFYVFLNLGVMGQTYKELHREAIVVDMHNDLLTETVNNDYDWSVKNKIKHTDIPRLIEGGVNVQFLAAWVSPRKKYHYEKAMELFECFNTNVEKNKSKVGQAKNYKEIDKLNKEGKIALVFCLEGGSVIENSIEKLKEFYSLGARYMTITWNNDINWAYCAKGANSKIKGLSAFGKKVIKTMDSLGMIIDVSHTGVKTIEDILKITKNPIVASHSGAYAINPHFRNLTDEQIIAIAKTGGVIGINFCAFFLSNTKKATVEDIVDHIDYIVQLVGVDYVGLGSDYDGILSVPKGMENVSKYPLITKTLLTRGYSEKDIKKILGGNILRVVKQVCK